MVVNVTCFASLLSYHYQSIAKKNLISLLLICQKSKRTNFPTLIYSSILYMPFYMKDEPLSNLLAEKIIKLKLI